MYLVKLPKWVSLIYGKKATWKKEADISKPSVYLTFDDGPHPKITPFVLDVLKKTNAKATFFCLGQNVMDYPNTYQQILKEGHAVGNHTFSHLNGSKTSSIRYIENIQQARIHIDSLLMRPPYGRIKNTQVAMLKQLGYEIIMWNLISGDFDPNISKERCLENVILNLSPGDIVVFHDSEKAWEKMSYVLPRVVEYCNRNKWIMKSL